MPSERVVLGNILEDLLSFRPYARSVPCVTSGHCFSARDAVACLPRLVSGASRRERWMYVNAIIKYRIANYLFRIKYTYCSFRRNGSALCLNYYTFQIGTRVPSPDERASCPEASESELGDIGRLMLSLL